ncbi:MAG: oatA 2 [Candidatus Eremiobacteraeota bacterium]|nr:oatA 2 [Candidatus Eremiobacteraeota bacterium]
MRGTAILFVLLYHFNVMGGKDIVWPDRFAGAIANSLWIGVDLFFVLSGFLITGILIDAKSKPNYFRNFYARRVLRIFPLYYLFVFALVFVLPHVVRGFEEPLHYLSSNQGWLWTYTTNVLIAVRADWTTAVPLANHFWSLAIEEQFYLVWPAVVLACDRRRLLIVCIAMIALAPALRTAVWLAGGNYLQAYVLTPARMDSLAVGALLAALVRSPAGMALAARWSKPVLIGGLALTAAMFCLRGLRFSEADAAVYTLGYSIVALTFGGLIVRAIVGGGVIERIMTLPPLRTFGTYAYGMYVFHPVVLRVFADHLSPRLHLPLVLGSKIGLQLWSWSTGIAVTFIVALASWHAYEKHFLKLKNRFRDEREAPRETRPAGTIEEFAK